MADHTDEFNLYVTNIHWVNFTHGDPNWKINLMNQTHHIMAYSTGGKAQYTIDGKQYFINKGDILFFPKNKMHAGLSDPEDPWSFYVILFDTLFTDKESEQRFNKMDNAITNINIPQLFSLLQDVHHEWITKKTGYLLKCRCRIMEIFSLLIRKMDSLSENSRHSQAIDSILNFMAENYKVSFTIDELCQLAGYSPSHFQLVFKKITGKTVIQYQNELRINRARELLQFGHCNVTEAAMHVGFNDIYYFSKLFKRTTGHNPSEFSKNNSDI